MIDGPDDEGEMFDRDALPSDKFVGPYENDKIARLANNGAYPPDLTLMVKARKAGAPDFPEIREIRIFGFPGKS